MRIFRRLRLFPDSWSEIGAPARWSQPIACSGVRSDYFKRGSGALEAPEPRGGAGAVRIRCPDPARPPLSSANPARPARRTYPTRSAECGMRSATTAETALIWQGSGEIPARMTGCRGGSKLSGDILARKARALTCALAAETWALGHTRRGRVSPGRAISPPNKRVSPGIRIFVPPLLRYGLHRPAPVAFSVAPIPAALSASAGQWPASLVIRLPSPTARSPMQQPLGQVFPSDTCLTLALARSLLLGAARVVPRRNPAVQAQRVTFPAPPRSKDLAARHNDHQP